MSIHSKISSLTLKADRALKSAMRNLVKERARTGDSLIIWRNGKVLKVPARQLLKK